MQICHRRADQKQKQAEAPNETKQLYALSFINICTEQYLNQFDIHTCKDRKVIYLSNFKTIT